MTTNDIWDETVLSHMYECMYMRVSCAHPNQNFVHGPNSIVVDVLLWWKRKTAIIIDSFNTQRFHPNGSLIYDGVPNDDTSIKQKQKWSSSDGCSQAARKLVCIYLFGHRPLIRCKYLINSVLCLYGFFRCCLHIRQYISGYYHKSIDGAQSIVELELLEKPLIPHLND